MPHRLLPAAALLLALTAPAHAILHEDETQVPPPTPVADCPDGEVWNHDSLRCEAADADRHGDAALYLAVRELAWIGRLDSAEAVLDRMSDPLDARVLTYRGFIARMRGDAEGAMAWYRAALAVDPDNLLVRSYMGQALAEAGDRAGAHLQLDQIRARGGVGTRAEQALMLALARP